jgi:hypothetical protein
VDVARDTYSNFLKLKGAQEKCRKSLLKTKIKEYNKRETEESDNILTIEELTGVFESELGSKCPTQLLSEDEFGLAPICTDEPLVLRNYIVVCILIENCARASIIAGMTMPEWEKRTFIDDQVVIKVHDHKTSASCGPIACILTLLTDSLLEAYINKIRVHNQDAYNNKQVFLCDSGSPVQSVQVHKLLNSFVKRTNAIPRITKLSPTDLRKMWVIWDRDRPQSTTENSELLAVYMQHNKKTADRWYDRRSKVTKSLKARSLPSGNLRKRADKIIRIL